MEPTFADMEQLAQAARDFLETWRRTEALLAEAVAEEAVAGSEKPQEAR